MRGSTSTAGQYQQSSRSPSKTSAASTVQTWTTPSRWNNWSRISSEASSKYTTLPGVWAAAPSHVANFHLWGHIIPCLLAGEIGEHTWWSGLGYWSLSSIGLYENGALSLSISILVEEYKCAKARLEMMLTEPWDPFQFSSIQFYSYSSKSQQMSSQCPSIIQSNLL